MVRVEIHSSPASGDARLLDAADLEEDAVVAWVGAILGGHGGHLQNAQEDDEITVTMIVTEKE